MSAPRERQIHGRDKLRFADNAALRHYYEEKYRMGGYDEGCVIGGLNLSALYHERRQHVALSFLEPLRDMEVLDAGCGAGVLAFQLASRGCRRVHAVDIAANAISPADAARCSNLHFQQMNVEALTFSDAKFDRVVSVETLEHVLAPEKAVRELYRVLRPGGRLVITYPTINRTTMKRLRLSWRMPISEHLNEWSYRELVRHATDCGLVLERSEGIAFDLGPLLALKKLHRVLSRGVTGLSLGIRAFPANSLFVCVAFRKEE